MTSPPQSDLEPLVDLTHRSGIDGRELDLSWTSERTSDNWTTWPGITTASAVGILSGNRSAGGVVLTSSGSGAWLGAQVQIPLYSVIFLLAVVGNGLVILTLARHKRMRTVTNVHLLNLAASDLLLGVFCMPFTLVGSLLRDFVFGEIMCKLIPYVQAVSVGVSAWTLVAISVERYYAICHPFLSRRWQTLSHAHRIIAIIWLGSLLSMTPIAALSVLQPLGDTGRNKCREIWPSGMLEKAFNIFLDAILLVLPLLIMGITYSLITLTLYQGIRSEILCRNGDDTRENSTIDRDSTRFTNGSGEGLHHQHRHHTIASRSESESTLAPGSLRSNATISCGDNDSQQQSTNKNWTSSVTSRNHASTPTTPSGFQHVRRSNVEASLANKKRVVKMLFAVVLEFFVCWTPLYVINTMALLDPDAVYSGLGPTGISFFHLLAYASSCSNPITYCFMNSKFRHAFLSAFGCRSDRWLPAALGSSSSKIATFQLSSRK